MEWFRLNFPKNPAAPRFHSTAETVGIIANDVANLISPVNGFKPFGRIFKFHLFLRSFEQGRELSAKGELLRHRIGALYVREIHGLFK